MNEAERKKLLAIARTGDMDAVIQGLKEAGAVEDPSIDCQCGERFRPWVRHAKGLCVPIHKIEGD